MSLPPSRGGLRPASRGLGAPPTSPARSSWRSPVQAVTQVQTPAASFASVAEGAVTASGGSLSARSSSNGGLEHKLQLQMAKHMWAAAQHDLEEKVAIIHSLEQKVRPLEAKVAGLHAELCRALEARHSSAPPALPQPFAAEVAESIEGALQAVISKRTPPGVSAEAGGGGGGVNGAPASPHATSPAVLAFGPPAAASWSLARWMEGVPLHEAVSHRLTKLIMELVPAANRIDGTEMSRVWLDLLVDLGAEPAPVPPPTPPPPRANDADGDAAEQPEAAAAAAEHGVEEVADIAGRVKMAELLREAHVEEALAEVMWPRIKAMGAERKLRPPPPPAQIKEISVGVEGVEEVEEVEIASAPRCSSPEQRLRIEKTPAGGASPMAHGTTTHGAAQTPTPPQQPPPRQRTPLQQRTQSQQSTPPQPTGRHSNEVPPSETLELGRELGSGASASPAAVLSREEAFQALQQAKIEMKEKARKYDETETELGRADAAVASRPSDFDLAVRGQKARQAVGVAKAELDEAAVNVHLAAKEEEAARTRDMTRAVLSEGGWAHHAGDAGTTPDECSFFFLDATRLRALYRESCQQVPDGQGKAGGPADGAAGKGSVFRLPMHQELREWCDGLLVTERLVHFSDVVSGAMVDEFCVVSHRWMGDASPDDDGCQAKAICDFLLDRPNIRYVWCDWCCMPQQNALLQRTDHEEREFNRMIANVNMLYAGCTVLILLDKSYVSRFWTLLEAWLAMTTPTTAGLRIAEDAPPRYAVSLLYGTTKYLQYALVEMLHATPEALTDFLAQPDVHVTSGKDKPLQLEKLGRLNERMTQMVRDKPILEVDVKARTSATPTAEEAVLHKRQALCRSLEASMRDLNHEYEQQRVALAREYEAKCAAMSDDLEKRARALATDLAGTRRAGGVHERELGGGAEARGHAEEMLDGLHAGALTRIEQHAEEVSAHMREMSALRDQHRKKLVRYDSQHEARVSKCWEGLRLRMRRVDDRRAVKTWVESAEPQPEASGVGTLSLAGQPAAAPSGASSGMPPAGAPVAATERANRREEIYSAAPGGARSLVWPRAGLVSGGLARLVGPPEALATGHTKLAELMEHEHTDTTDSHTWFVWMVPTGQGTPPSMIRTTPAIEWWVVADPSEARLDKLRQSHRPYSDLDWPVDILGPAAPMSRLQSLRTIQAKIDRVNERLHALSEPELVTRTGVVALRLFTGPMGVHYRRAVSAAEAREEARRAAPAAAGSVKSSSNYTNTLHVLSNALSKLGRLTLASPVYFALRQAEVPTSFWRRGGQGDEWVGGVELGFLTTSSSAERAIKAARTSTADTADATAEAVDDDEVMLFEIHQGPRDRGAAISWLSMHPAHDDATLIFPPLTALEVMAVRNDGARVVLALHAATSYVSLHEEGVEAAERQLKEKNLREREEEALRLRGVHERAREVLRAQMHWQEFRTHTRETVVKGSIRRQKTWVALGTMQKQVKERVATHQAETDSLARQHALQQHSLSSKLNQLEAKHETSLEAMRRVANLAADAEAWRLAHSWASTLRDQLRWRILNKKLHRSEGALQALIREHREKAVMLGSAVITKESKNHLIGKALRHSKEELVYVSEQLETHMAAREEAEKLVDELRRQIEADKDAFDVQMVKEEARIRLEAKRERDDLREELKLITAENMKLKGK